MWCANMERLLEHREEERVEREKRKHKRMVTFLSVFAAFAAVAFVGFLVNSFINREYAAYETMHSMPRQDSSTVRYLPYNGAILKYTRDGASAMNAEGTIFWNGSYELNNPEADICGQYVVIADIGGKEAYVFNGTDSGTKISTLLPILEAEVASQGLVALVLEDTDSNEIQLHNPYEGSNSLLVKIPTNTSTDGYPIDIALSEDGKKLVTSYVAIENGELKNKVTFYNFGEIGQNKANNIVGGIDCGANVVARVTFLNNDTIALMQEKSLILYSMPELPREVAVLDAGTEISSVLHGGSTVGCVAGGKLVLYGLGGGKKLQLSIDWEYDEAELIGEDIIFRSELACHVLRLGGSVKLSCSFDKHILYMFPASKKDHYIFIDENNIEEVKLLEAAK